MHGQTSNNKPGEGHQPEQLQIGCTMLITVGRTGFCSQPASLLASTKTLCWIPRGRWRGTTTYLNINGLFYFGRIVMFYFRDCSHSSLSQFAEQFSHQPAVTSIFQLLLLDRNKMLLDLWAELWDGSSVELFPWTVVDGQEKEAGDFLLGRRALRGRKN